MERTRDQSRAPHMLAFAVASVVSGVLQVAAGTGQLQVSAMSQGGVAFLWSGLAIGGGLSVLAGAMLRDVSLGLHVERVGHLGLVFAVVTYVASLIGLMSSPWWTSTAFWVTTLLMAASLARIWLITKVLWQARRFAARRGVLE